MNDIKNHDHPNLYRSYFTYTYAPIWKRFVAYFLDMCILSLLIYVVYLIIQMLTFFTGILPWSEFVDRHWYWFVLGEFIVLNWFYFTFFSSTSLFSTPGQFICRIKQIDKTGNKISFRKANARYFSSIFSKILYIGYIMVYMNPYRQTFHEMLTNVFLVER
ncbi:MAG: RDD family protein [Bacilli bacterium]|nr:RDD family protein [Bacilli bacterium]